MSNENERKNENNSDKERIPFSFHTFYFVFTYNETKKEFEKGLVSKYWEELKNDSKEDALNNYQVHQYFYKHAREILGFAGEGSVSTNVYRSTLVQKNCSKISIHKPKGKELLEVALDDIKLYSFDHQIGILSYETRFISENAKNWQDNVKEAKYINEYFRRIFPEYIAETKPEEGSDKKENKKYFCGLQPTSIILTGLNNNVEIIEENNDETYERYLEKKNSLSPVVYKLFGEEEDNCKIRSVLDDRMFVCSIICSSNYSKYLLEKREKKNKCKIKYGYEVDEIRSKDLYELIMIDQPDNCCAQDYMVRKYDFEKALYRRWIDYGTIHGVTNYSIICVTGDVQDVRDTVLNPFLRLYTKMAMIVLLQRASLNSFNTKLSECVDKISEEEPSEESLNDVSNLSMQFADFQGKYLMPEVTSQIQGIEIYNMLQRQLGIEKNEQNVQRQLNNVYKTLNAKLELSTKAEQEKTDKALAFLAVLAIVSAFTDAGAFFRDNIGQPLPWIVLIIIVFVIIAHAPFITKAVRSVQEVVERLWKKIINKGDKR